MSPTFPLLGHKSPTVIEAKVAVGKVGKEERKGAAQEKKVPGIRDKEEKKGAKTPGKEVCAGVVCTLDGTGENCWSGSRRASGENIRPPSEAVEVMGSPFLHAGPPEQQETEDEG